MRRRTRVNFSGCSHNMERQRASEAASRDAFIRRQQVRLRRARMTGCYIVAIVSLYGAWALFGSRIGIGLFEQERDSTSHCTVRRRHLVHGYQDSCSPPSPPASRLDTNSVHDVDRVAVPGQWRWKLRIDLMFIVTALGCGLCFSPLVVARILKRCIWRRRGSTAPVDGAVCHLHISQAATTARGAFFVLHAKQPQLIEAISVAGDLGRCACD